MTHEDITVSLVDDDATGTSRADVLKRAATVGGAVVLGGVAVTGIPRLAVSAPSRKQDVKVLNYALILETLQSEFYANALKSGNLTGEWKQFAQTVGQTERAHLAYLKRSLGADAGKVPKFRFGDSGANIKRFAAAAIALEDLGTAAYNGQAANLTPKALTAALRIMSVEARHAAWVRDLAGEQPAPDPVDKPAAEASVNRTLRRRGLIG